MNKKITVFSLIALLVCLSGFAWGATEGSSNTAFGGATGLSMGPGVLASGLQADTFIGSAAGLSNTGSGAGNTFVGNGAGLSNTAGSSNSFLGAFAGSGNVTGSSNSIAGRDAGSFLNAGSDNSFFGYQAGFSATGSFNSFLGSGAGYKNTGSDNVNVGFFSGYNNVGNQNTFVGTYAGNASSLASSPGAFNAFFGYAAGYKNTTGDNNVAIGSSAGFSNDAGSSNVFIGAGAGYSETSSNRLYIDNCITGDTPQSGGMCTQPLIYGEFDTRLVRIDGSLTAVTMATPSDLRYKKDIHPLESSLDKVLLLQGVAYEWDKGKVSGAGYKSGNQIGLIAQEVEKVLPELVHTDGKGYKTLSYDKLVPVLVEAVKEQQQLMLQKDSEQSREILEQQAAFLGAAADKDAEIKFLKQAMVTVIHRLAAVESSVKTVASK
ncbi:MAG: tail fiber domain-containing protein [Thermodesulfovibrionales bacterium]